MENAHIFGFVLGPPSDSGPRGTPNSYLMLLGPCASAPALLWCILRILLCRSCVTDCGCIGVWRSSHRPCEVGKRKVHACRSSFFGLVLPCIINFQVRYARRMSRQPAVLLSGESKRVELPLAGSASPTLVGLIWLPHVAESVIRLSLVWLLLCSPHQRTLLLIY